jgi:uncharacterized protein (DUF2132 family)
MTEDHEILHGVKLADILTYLVDKYGWNVLGYRIRINCFNSNPTVKSSLKFLRRTQWARDKVDELYVESIKEDRAASSSE